MVRKVVVILSRGPIWSFARQSGSLTGCLVVYALSEAPLKWMLPATWIAYVKQSMPPSSEVLRTFFFTTSSSRYFSGVSQVFHMLTVLLSDVGPSPIAFFLHVCSVCLAFGSLDVG